MVGIRESSRMEQESSLASRVQAVVPIVKALVNNKVPVICRTATEQQEGAGTVFGFQGSSGCANC
mgnify:CR=1 FL=1